MITRAVERLAIRWPTEAVDDTSSADATDTKILRKAAHSNRVMVTWNGWCTYKEYRVDFEASSSVDPIVLSFCLRKIPSIEFHGLPSKAFEKICSFLDLRDVIVFVNQSAFSHVLGTKSPSRIRASITRKIKEPTPIRKARRL